MLNVVVIEGDAALARLYREELEEAGFTVRLCRDSSQALSELRTKPAHVVLTEPHAVLGDLGHWLDQLRSLHNGGVVMLGQPPRRGPAPRACKFVPKSSDLSPLIQSVRGQAIKAVWLRAANC